MRFVDLKSQEQLDTQTLHRARDRLIGERTALINQLRAILLERGIVVPRGRGRLEGELAILIDENQGAGLSPRVVKLICDMRTQWGVRLYEGYELLIEFLYAAVELLADGAGHTLSFS